MNERIQELADQAEDYADSVVDQGGEFHPAYTQKLAELIVGECCSKCVGQNQYKLGFQLAKEFQEHFGIKH